MIGSGQNHRDVYSRGSFRRQTAGYFRGGKYAVCDCAWRVKLTHVYWFGLHGKTKRYRLRAMKSQSRTPNQSWLALGDPLTFRFHCLGRGCGEKITAELISKLNIY